MGHLDSTFNTACSRAPGLKTSWWGWGGILPTKAADRTCDCGAVLPLPAFSSSVKGMQLQLLLGIHPLIWVMCSEQYWEGGSFVFC